MLGFLLGRLLLEPLNAVDANALTLGYLGTAVNVAVAGSGVGRRDTEGNQGDRMFLRRLLGHEGGTDELAFRLDNVVGRHDHHHGVGILASDEGGAQANARSGIAAARFADDLSGRQFRQLLARLLAVGLTGNDPGSAGGEGLDAVAGLLQQRTVAGQGEELLGPSPSAARQKRVPPPPAMMTAWSMASPCLGGRRAGGVNPLIQNQGVYTPRSPASELELQAIVGRLRVAGNWRRSVS